MSPKSSKLPAPVILSQDDVDSLVHHHTRYTLGSGASCTVRLVDYKGVACCLKLAKKRHEGFLQEAGVLQALKGAGGAPQLLGVTESKGGQHMALLTTFCGTDTFLRLRHVARNDAEVLHALLQLCRALQKVHDRGFVHNDIKGDNVMVRRDAPDGPLHVSLIDYGLARRKGVPLFTTPRTFGHRSWMAPEVYDCDPCHASMDVYSLGRLMQGILRQCQGQYPRLS